MLNIDTAKRSDLEVEILFNTDLYNYIWTVKKYEPETFIEESTTEELRKFVKEFVINNNEVNC